MNTQYNKHELFFGFYLFLLLGLTYFLYAPGQEGGFLFDDFPNLSPMGSYNNIDSWKKASEFIFSGFSGPTGRPVSLATFLIDDYTWPSSESSAFKQTNIQLHLLCGVLIYWITFILTKQHINTKNTTALLVSTITTSFWLLHPYLVSTTLYVIQRMTILMTFFSLLSVLFFLKGRCAINQSPAKSTLLILLAYSIFIPLSIFSKENGALTPLYILLIERSFFFQDKIHHKHLNILIKSIINLSSVCVVGLLFYYLFNVISAESSYSHRDFTLTERLLTESRILFIYLHHWFIPPIQTAGLYNDFILISTNLFTPISTLISITIHFLIISGGIYFRHKYPLISFPILFFYIAHLLESSFIPLELYFEHRNYLSTAFLFLPISYYLIMHFKKKQITLALLTLILTLIISLMLFLRVSIWQNTDTAKLIWASQSPHSLRAQLDSARYYLFKGNLSKSLYYSEKASHAKPTDPKPLIFKEVIYCLNRNVTQSEKRNNLITKRLNSSTFHVSQYEYINYLISIHNEKKCDNINYSQLLKIINARLSNHQSIPTSFIFMFENLKGKINLYNQNPDKALAQFKKILIKSHNIDMTMNNIAELSHKGYYDEGLDLLLLTREILNANITLNTGFINYKDEVNRLEKILLNDIKEARK